MHEIIFVSKRLPKLPDYLAPDGSEIRTLANMEAGGLCHCTLRSGGISKAVKHKSVEEIWYCTSGKGIIWQKNEYGEDVKEFTTGDSFTIPKGNSFQFRNTGTKTLKIIISTMPKWPGAHEAVDVKGKWKGE